MAGPLSMIPSQGAAKLMPADRSCVQVVYSFHELAETPFAGSTNALCWERTLPGDFAEIVTCLGSGAGQSVNTLDPVLLRALPLSAAGKLAVECMLADARLLSDRNLAPELNCIHGYPRDERPGPIAADVFSFHVDSASVETDTWLCTYHGPASEGLCNGSARRRVDMPDTRAALLAAYGGADGAGFRGFLTDNAYDLHYVALPDARPYSYGTGSLWRIATAYPGCPVPPGIHRAPPPKAGDPPRLLLIS
jgi:hypothetical protein